MGIDMGSLGDVDGWGEGRRVSGRHDDLRLELCVMYHRETRSMAASLEIACFSQTAKLGGYAILVFSKVKLQYDQLYCVVIINRMEDHPNYPKRRRPGLALMHHS